VGALQSALIRLGHDPGRIDGVMGDRTLAAMRDAGLDRTIRSVRRTWR
jgi:peptidoglycan hydrolase-like protein with peptidoglycan-binding domain